MSVVKEKKTSVANIVVDIGLGLFSLGAFNFSGQFFFLLTFCYLTWKAKTVIIARQDIIIFLFSISYFVIYTINFGFEIKKIITYLWGPWAAYLFGKWFVISNDNTRAFEILTNILAFGFFTHSVLNLFAYLNSEYFAQYSYQRVAVDFWRGDIVSVISTGLMLMFAIAISISTLFAYCDLRKKIISLIVLFISVFEICFFAYRTMLFITIILIIFNMLRWIYDSEVQINKKVIYIGFVMIFTVGVFLVVFLNLFGARDELMSLKIIRRLLYDEKTSRIRTWKDYLFSGDWLIYPFGGQKSEHAYKGEWVHNLWFDILNKVGLIPFIIALIFTISNVCSVYHTTVYIKKDAADKTLSNQIANLGLGMMLICMPEPIIDANPYFFLAILMLLGGINGLRIYYI